MNSSVFIVSACRTAIGKFGGSLAEVSPSELGAVAFKEAVVRASTNKDLFSNIDEVIVGNVLAAGHGMNIARQVSIKAGVATSTPATAVNMVCGSGLKAVALGAQSILCGAAETVLVGGVESMSQSAYVSLGSRWGAKMGHLELKDLMLQDGLTDAFGGCHMGITAENLVERFKISRADQDKLALESQKKAELALKAGKFKDEIVPFPIVKKGKQVGTFDTDEYPRADATIEALSALKPAFKKDGSVTAGNSSGINDGAAALLLMSEQALKKSALKPLARVVGFASSGVEPEIMGIGPVEAVKKVLKQTTVSLSSIDLIEANEAFAAQAIAVSRSLEWDEKKVNVNGGAIALGHPIGASGARILVTLVHELKRSGGRYGIATLCVGGGQGIAMIVERA